MTSPEISLRPGATSENLACTDKPREEFDPARWLADFEGVGSGFVIGNDCIHLCIMHRGYPPHANHEARRLLDIVAYDPAKLEAVKELIEARNQAAFPEGEGA